jgi:hypothetical protein
MDMKRYREALDIKKKIDEIESSYSNRIKKLEEERWAIIESLNDSGFQEVLDNMERHFEHLNKFISGTEIAEVPGVPYYCTGDTAIATLRDDKYNKINLYIVRNRNKVKGFTLLIEGNTALRSSSTVSREIKTASTEEELLKYVSRNMGKIKAKLPITLDELTAEYETVVKMFKDVEIQKHYLKYRMDYYTNDVTDYADEPGYKDIVAIYNQLEKNPLDLVLLVGVVESEEGREILDKLLRI